MKLRGYLADLSFLLTLGAGAVALGILVLYFVTADAHAATIHGQWSTPTHRCDGSEITAAEKARMTLRLYYDTSSIPAADKDCSDPADAPPNGVASVEFPATDGAGRFDVVGGFTYFVRGSACIDNVCSNLSAEDSTYKEAPPPEIKRTYRPAILLVDDSAIAVFPPVHTIVRYESDETIARASGRWLIRFGFETCPTESEAILSRDENGAGAGGHVSFFMESGCRVTARFQSADNAVSLTGETVIGAGVHEIEFIFGALGATISVDGEKIAADPTFTQGLDDYNGPLIFNGTCWVEEDAENTCGPNMPASPSNFFSGYSSLQIFEE